MARWRPPRSYSLYLVHVPVGFTILTALVVTAKLPYTVALLVALVAVAIVTELAYRFVEKPSIRLGRRLTTRPSGRARDRPAPRHADAAGVAAPLPSVRSLS
jgi:exopolysaccharide production protein ExoZ